MFNGQENGLNGQYIIAQGKRLRSVALGWSGGTKIVRAITFIKKKILFRTKQRTSCFPEIMSYNSVRRELFALFNESSRTVFILRSLPRAAFRIVPPETLPYAIIFWPFRPKKYTDCDLCIMSSYTQRGEESDLSGLG